MPAVTTGKVLVSGANGFVAMWVLQDLLEHGFSVRGTLRSESKATHLREVFSAHGDKLELIIVPDIEEEGAFDAATEGVDAILHIASPVTYDGEPDDIIRPAVNGTTSILNSALLRDTVKRVVFMSSTAAILNPTAPLSGAAEVLDERNWNEHSAAIVREKGKDASGPEKYQASKVLAERAAWDFFEREKSKGGLGWDLVALNSSWVFGPVLHEVPSLQKFATTASLWYHRVVRGVLQGDALTKQGLEWVHVRDVARAHVLALKTPEAGGERFIISGGRAVWQDFVNAARRLSDKIPPGDPSYNPDEAEFTNKYNADKSKKVLGIQYRTLEELTKDAIDDFRARGWVE